jgi:CheY-like chemotaxis protein
MSRSLHVILAEDNDDDIETFEKSVRKCCPSLLVTYAKDGKQLFEMVDRLMKVDLIVLDLTMPYYSGLACVEKIRTIEQYDKTPIIIHSITRDQNEINKCLKAGADYFFVKKDDKEVDDLVNGIGRKIFSKRYNKY